jgi:hypothetical protein
MKSLLSVGDMKKPFGIFWMFVFTICLSGCWRRIIVEWKKDISHIRLCTYRPKKEGFCDVLGDMFMECVSHGNNGQFFTPIHVADLMACMGGNRLKPKQSVCDSCCGSGRMLLSAVKKCAEENDGGRLFCYGSDIDLICVKMTVVNLMMNSVPGEVAWMNTLTMQHWRSYHIDLQLIAGVWLPILKITEAGDTSFIRKLENAMEDNSELKRSIQSNARATQLTFDF